MIFYIFGDGAGISIVNNYGPKQITNSGLSTIVPYIIKLFSNINDGPEVVAAFFISSLVSSGSVTKGLQPGL
jgi:uncharacterized membrane protein YjjB (DUF3815 family)